MFQEIYNQLEFLNRKFSNNPKALGFQKLTVNGSAANMTIPEGSTSAICIVESTTAAPTIAIRFREDGTAATATVGMPRCNGDAFEIQDTENLRRFSIIEATAATTVLNITYYKK